MRTLYIECRTGASGDMLLGALSSLLDDPSEFKNMVASLNIPGITVSLEKGESEHICGTKVHIFIDGVEEGHEHHHEHHILSDVLNVISQLPVSDKVRSDATAIYRTIAEAESAIHGQPVDLIHFHEVGALDAIADIVGSCMLIEKLDPERIVVSPIRTGYGTVQCAHGLLPVPAPATANILKGMPVYSGDEEGEFCTPTGAAILKHFADEYGVMPAMTMNAVGIGIGSKKFRNANILRAFMGEVGDSLPVIKQIDCNIDDMAPEDLGGIIDSLLRQGALDAFIKPCIMKKGRPGFELTCLCREKDFKALSMYILAHTSTIGLRAHDCERYAMTSRFETVETEYGPVRIKISEGFGLSKRKAEYDDLKTAADRNGVPISEVRRSIDG